MLSKKKKKKKNHPVIYTFQPARHQVDMLIFFLFICGYGIVRVLDSAGYAEEMEVVPLDFFM